MILCRRSVISWLLVFLILTFGTLGSLAYLFLLRAPHMSPETLKFTAERFLFFTILACLVFLVLFSRIVFGSIRFSKSLEKLLTLSRSSGYSPDAGLRKLGVIGVYLADIFYEMNRLSEKKSLKISALNSLSDHLTDLSTQKIFVISASGMVLYASRSLLDELNIPKTEVIGKKAETLFPDINIQHSLDEVFFSRLESELDSGAGILIPVLNHKKETAYGICQFQKIKGVTVTADSVKSLPQKNRKMSAKKLTGTIGSVFKPRSKRK